MCYLVSVGALPALTNYPSNDIKTTIQPLATAQALCGNSVRRIGNVDYVTHLVRDIPHARQIADAICEQCMIPVYFGTGYAVNHPHLVRLDYGNELVLRFFPRGEDRSGSADDYTTVHTFKIHY